MNPPDSQTLFRFFTEIGILHQLGRTLVEERLPGTMTANQFGLLGHLSRRPDGNTPLQLTTAFQVPKTTMTHMISVLRGRSLIELTQNPKDKRSKIVRITPEGLAFLQSTIESLKPAMAGVVAETGISAFSDILPQLSDIREKMDQSRNPDDT